VEAHVLARGPPRCEAHRARPRRFRGGATAPRYELALRIARSSVACTERRARKPRNIIQIRRLWSQA
jgi:hypothetical protein